MKKRILIFLISIVTAAFALPCAAFADFSASEKAAQAVDSITAFELQKNGCSSIQEWIDGNLTQNAGQSSEWNAIVLARSGDHDFSAYKAALEKYISENNIPSATSRMKNALALLAVGGNKQIADDIAESSVGEQGIMSLIYGLHLLNNGCGCSRYTVDSLTDELLALQFDDGGWAIMGENGDIDVTAMSVQALAPQYSENEKVSASIDKALGFLSAKQQNDGGYKSFGTANPESASQVLIAVSAVGADIGDTRFIKNGNDLIDGIIKFRLDDGSFSHTEGGDTNDTATVQAYLALTAYTLSLEGERLYDFPAKDVQDELKPISETEVSSAVITTAPAETEAPAVTSVTERTDIVVSNPQSAGYKPIAYCVIAGLVVIACVILFALGKKRISNFVAVIIIAAAAAAFVFFTDFRSSEEYYSGTAAVKENAVGTVSMTIRCDTVIGKSDADYIPADGIILDTTEFPIAEGDTVYDILTEAAKQYNIQLQTNAGSYIAGIGYLYEYDFGDLSGWIYHVNGDSPFVMCSDYTLKDGDRIEWLYTCELGNDL